MIPPGKRCKTNYYKKTAWWMLNYNEVWVQRSVLVNTISVDICITKKQDNIWIVLTCREPLHLSSMSASSSTERPATTHKHSLVTIQCNINKSTPKQLQVSMKYTCSCTHSLFSEESNTEFESYFCLCIEYPIGDTCSLFHMLYELDCTLPIVR